MIIENETICLEQAAASHQTEAERMKQEFFDFGETIINGSALFDQMLFPKSRPEHGPQGLDCGNNFLRLS